MGWREIFRRKLAPVAPVAPIAVFTLGPSESFRAGDLVECVTGGHWINLLGALASGPETGETYVVDQVSCNEIGRFLVFRRFGSRLYSAANFRKIVPVADKLERSEPAFLDLIRKPVRETV